MCSRFLCINWESHTAPLEQSHFITGHTWYLSLGA